MKKQLLFSVLLLTSLSAQALYEDNLDGTMETEYQEYNVPGEFDASSLVDADDGTNEENEEGTYVSAVGVTPDAYSGSIGEAANISAGF